MKGEGGAQPSSLPAPTGCQHHWYPDHHFASSEVCSFPAQLEQPKTIEKTELMNHLWLQAACKSDSLVVTK
jgi:hypothetical protein